MGSKEKTYSGLNAARMFDDKDNLYAQELIRIYAQIGTIEADKILPPVLNDANQFFNEKVFEKMGSTVDVNIDAGIMTEEGILNEIRKQDSSAYSVIDYFIKDSNHKSVDSSLLKLQAQMNYKYPYMTDCTTIGYDSHAYEGGSGMFEVIYGTYIISNKRYKIPMVSGKPIFTEDTMGSYVTMYQIEDDSCTELNPLVTVDISYNPNDAREVMAVSYMGSGGRKHAYIFTEYIIREQKEYKGFMLVMRKDFNNVDPKESKESKFMFARFGLNAEDEDGNTLVDSLEQEDLKDAFLTYASHRENKMFNKFINDVYKVEPVEDGGVLGVVKPPNEVSIRGDINFTYENVMNLDEEPEYTIFYGSNMSPADKKDEDGEWESTYILPLEVMKEQHLRHKFTAYNQCFTMFAYSEKTVKLKWYQTAFFRVIMMIIAIVIAVYTGVNIQYLLLGQAAVQLATLIDPRLGAIVGIVVGILSGNFSGGFNFNTILNITNNILSVVQTFNVVAFQKSMDSLRDQIEGLKEKTEEVQDEIEDILKDTIYIPFGDKVDYMYNGLFDTAVMTPDLLYNSVDMAKVADYDKYYKTF